MTTDILYACKPSLRRAYYYSAICMGLLGVSRYFLGDTIGEGGFFALFFVLLLLLAWAHLVRFCTLYTLTEDRLSVQSGILARQVSAIPLVKVTNFFSKQSFLERLLCIINVGVDTAGGDHLEAVLRRITNSDHKMLMEKAEELLKRNKNAAAASGQI